MLKSLSARLGGGLAALIFALSIVGAKPAQAQAGTEYIGQISVFGNNFCPRNWAPADGQLLPISQHNALFSILGTIYGGDGRTTFALPDLRGRAPIGEGFGPALGTILLGERGGAESKTLVLSELPSHSHSVNVTNAIGDKGGPGSDFLAAGGPGHRMYHDGPPNKTMDPAMIADTGGNLPFDLRDPYLGMTWCIALTGIYPSRS